MDAEPTPAPRRGMVLIIVLVAIMMLTLAGLTFAQLMLAEREAAWTHGRAVQSRALVDSGVAWIEQQTAQSAMLDQSSAWYDNPALFKAQLVLDDTVDRDRGKFTVLAPRTQHGTINGVRYGLEDESGRLNLNTLLLFDPVWQSTAAQAVASVTQSSGTSQSSATAQTSATAQSSSVAQSSSAAASSSPSSGSSSSSGSSGTSSTSSSQVTAQQALLGLPGMTIDIADSILDWLDPDDTARTNGAEREYYSGLNPPRVPKNGPIETVEELLLIKGVTPQLLFGVDINRNSLVDSQEMKLGMPATNMSNNSSSSNPSSTSSGSSTSSSGTSSGSSGGITGLPTTSAGGSSSSSASMSQGWAAYLTVYSHESNLQPNGQPKINVNATDLQQLYQAISSALGADVATFVIGFRQGKVVTGSQTTVAMSGKTPNFNTPGNTMLASPLDLVGCKVQVSFQGDQTPSVVNSPFDPTPQIMVGYISTLLDHLTIVPSTTVPGRINVNHAPLPVLMTIPGMDSTTANLILSSQQAAPNMLGTNRKYPTWLYTEGLITLDAMKQLMPYVTATGHVYRAQVVGFFDSGGPTCRAEVVVDATTSAPRLLLWRELTHLGPGYGRQLLGALK